MPPPRNLRELKSLRGTYIIRFISNISGRCQPFSRLMKKGVAFQWDSACQNAFESIKATLLNHLCQPTPQTKRRFLWKPLDFGLYLWQLREMYFDGASQREPGSGRDAPKTRAGAGVVFLTPEKGVLHYSFTLLKENC